MRLMPIVIFSLFSLFSAGFTGDVDVNGAFDGKGSQGLPSGWTFNAYAGFRPNPEIKRNDGELSFGQAKGKNGFGVNSKPFPVSPGGKVSLYAEIRGSGMAYFRIHLLNKTGKWLGLGIPKNLKLRNDWQKIELELPVANTKPDELTAQARIMFGTGSGGKLAIRNLKAGFKPGRYIAGRGGFPRGWKLYLPVDPKFTPKPEDLLKIPAVFGGAAAKDIHPDGVFFDLKNAFGGQKTGNCAWLFNELTVSKPAEFTIGAGADWWITVYINGKPVIDTSKTGNVSGKLEISNQTGTVWLKKGRNTVAVRYVTGAGSSRLCIGGPDDFSDRESFKMVKYCFFDDFEKPMKRSGQPEITSGIISSGLLVSTRKGKYGSNAVLLPKMKIAIPLSLTDARFAWGFRLYELNGTLSGIMGKTVLKFTRSGGDIQAGLEENGKTIFTMPVPISLLPADLLFTAGMDGKCNLTVKSLADSSRHRRNGRIHPPKSVLLELSDGSSVEIDLLQSGLAMPEEQKKRFPFKLTPAKFFDPVKAGWKLAFEEHFEGTQPDPARWMNKYPDHVYLDGKGHLIIKADFDQKKQLRSGGLTSRQFFGYGWYEARLKFTRQPGWWSAFWLFGTGNHPMLDGIEIDIYEDYYTRKAKTGDPLTLDHNVHTSTGTTRKSWNYLSTIPAAEADQFHTIACKRTPFEISLYLDGRLIAARAAHSDYDSVTFDPFFHGGSPVKLNAIFSGIPMRTWGRSWSDPAKGKFPEYFMVDYFRFYEYPADRLPAVRWKKTVKTDLRLLRPGTKFVFEAEAEPSPKTKSPVREMYLMDNGAMIASSTNPDCQFEISIDPLYYANTPYVNPGRSGIVPGLDGLHGFAVFARDAAGMGSCTEPQFVLIVPDRPTSPYQGKAAKLPGIVNPAFYDKGGNGAAYSDSKGNFFNKPGKKTFRPGEDVDAAGNVIGRVVAGEWLKYTVDIESAGDYRAVLNYGTPVRGRDHRLYLFIDGIPEPAGIFTLKPHKEPHWKCSEKAEIRTVRLPKGRHRLVLVPVGAFNFSNLEFTKSNQ